MTKLQKQLTSVLASIAMISSSVMPAFAATIELSGNGSNSQNQATVQVNNTTQVIQNNDTDVDNDVDVDADTGNNEANSNTGGEVSVDTGDAIVDVKVANDVNRNHVELDNCGTCDSGDTDVLIQGNGDNSRNKVGLSRNNDLFVTQYNEADIETDVDVDADTGDNEANSNTGGDVEVLTGDALVGVKILNTANINTARVGGNGEGGGSLSARILENGADSRNTIGLALNRGINLDQDNDTDIDNDVDVDADTGDNDAKYNTGGDVLIDTGDAGALVTIDNMAGFNAADVDCGCLFEDVLAKIWENGADSRNTIRATLGNKRESNTYIDQNNYGKGIDNDVDVDLDSGDNDVKSNTNGDSDADPAVMTGDALAEINLSTTAGQNVVGDSEFELPEGMGNVSFNFMLDFSDLMELLSWLSN